MNVSGQKIRSKRKLRDMSLEGLSESMEGAGVPVSVSTLQRIEKGEWKRAPDKRVIETIAERLRLDKEALIQSVEEDRRAKAEAELRSRLAPPVLLTDIVEFSRRSRMTIRSARTGGDVQYALKNANWVDAVLQRSIERTRTTVALDALAVARAYVLAEKAHIFSDTLSASEVWRMLIPILREGRRLQRLISDEKMAGEVKALNCSIVQGLYYMKDKHATALRHRIGEGEIIRDPYWKLALHRVSASSLAHVKEEKKALREKDKIQSMLDSGEISRPYTTLWAMDAIGRVHAIARDPEAFPMFDHLWSLYGEIRKEHGRSRLREAQLAMDNLRAVVHIDPDNIGLAEQLARKGREAADPQTAGNHEYPRHRERIDHLMSDLYERNRRQDS